MAWRDARSSLNRLLLFMASIVLGIAALVAIQSFGLTLEDTISGQSRELMGADFLVDTESAPSEILNDTLVQIPGRQAREVNFVSMISFVEKPGTRLVRVRGIEPGYPFYGRVETQPAEASRFYKEDGGALADAALMTQFNLQVGDTLKIGELKVPIQGKIIQAPGNTQVATSVAPVVWLPYRLIPETQLIQTGSRVGYNIYFKAEKGANLQDIYNRWDPILDDLNADMDLHTDTSQRLGRRFNNVGRFLKLVAFIALLLGCMGIASAVHIYMRDKRNSIAILKCLGASRADTFRIFLIQIIGIGFLGGLLGSILGYVLQGVFPLFIADFLPVELQWDFYWKPLGFGLFLGISMSLLFGLLPLIRSWFVSPLAVLRIDEGSPPVSKRVSLTVMVFIFGILWGVAYLLLQRAMQALWFVVGMAVAVLILGALTWLLMRLIRRYFPKGWSFEARQGIQNLFRPNNQTLVLILAIGLGTFLISTLYFTQDMLLARAKIEDQTPAANLILLDIQPGQQEGVAEVIGSAGMPLMENIPIVTLRLDQIAGKSVESIRRDTTSRINPWILSHEFRVTYRDTLIASESLQSGEWVAEYSGDGPVPISLSDNVARDALVGIGDTLMVNVQGVLMPTVVGSIRAVDWGRMQLNFSMVFPRGVLEEAPQFQVMTTYADNANASAGLQQQLVQRFPNITALDVRQILDAVGDILDKIGWIIRFMAFFSILTGLIVLLGAVRTSKFQRMREGVLLRTIGADSRQIIRINTLEYVFLGLIGSIMGALLALMATQLLAVSLFEVSFNPSLIPFLIVIPSITLMVVWIGRANSKSVVKSPPLEVLRKEGV